MMEARNTALLWRATAIATWAAVTGVALWFTSRGHAVAASTPLAVLAALGNLAAMLHVLRDGRRSRGSTRLALAVQLASALLLGVLLPLGFMPIYTVLWIAMAAQQYAYRALWGALAVTTVAWYLIMRFVWQDDQALVDVLLYGTFHLFAMLSGWNARQAESARDELARSNRELIATQHLLSEAARQGERARIARDLHDALGHHLTALSIQLQLAERKATGELKDALGESRALARLLLSDVRETLSTVREHGELSIEQALRALAAGTPGLDVHVAVKPELGLVEVAVAESLIRCAQEAITNALRHAGATQCWVEVGRDARRVVLTIRDDGRADRHVQEGNGLRGMRERLEAVSGTLQLDASGGSLELRAEVPAA